MADTIQPSPVAPEAGTSAEPSGSRSRRSPPGKHSRRRYSPCWEFAGRNSNGRRISGPTRRTQRPGCDDLHDDPCDHFRRAIDLSGAHRFRRGVIGGRRSGFSGRILSAQLPGPHRFRRKEGGVLLYDSDNVEPNLDDKRFVYVGVPITGLTVEALGGTAKDKGKNIFVLGLDHENFQSRCREAERN